MTTEIEPTLTEQLAHLDTLCTQPMPFPEHIALIRKRREIIKELEKQNDNEQ